MIWQEPITGYGKRQKKTKKWAKREPVGLTKDSQFFKRVASLYILQ